MSSPPSLFTICALLYGDHLSLARRCLDPLRKDLPPGVELRIGLNAVSSGTLEYVRQAVVAKRPNTCCCQSRENIHKYPMMRSLIEQGPLAPYLMWFDDDSFVVRRDLHQWLAEIARALTKVHMVGSIYTIPFQGNQRDWIKDQPWYRGKDPNERRMVTFCTGGWWAIRTDVLTELNYPWEELDHRGGDAMLGEALFQLGYKLGAFRDGLRINADEIGRESRAPRRGFDSVPIGYNYVRAEPAPAETAALPPPKRSFLDLDL